MPTDDVFRMMQLRQDAAGPFMPARPLLPVLSPAGEFSPEYLRTGIDSALVSGDEVASQLRQQIEGGVLRMQAAGQTQQAIISNAIRAPLAAAMQDAYQVRQGIAESVLAPIRFAIGEGAELVAGMSPAVALAAPQVADPGMLMPAVPFVGGESGYFGSTAAPGAPGIAPDTSPGLSPFPFGSVSPGEGAAGPSPGAALLPGAAVPPGYASPSIPPGSFGVPAAPSGGFGAISSPAGMPGYMPPGMQAVVGLPAPGAAPGVQCTYFQKLKAYFPEATIWQEDCNTLGSMCSALNDPTMNPGPLRCVGYPFGILPAMQGCLFFIAPEGMQFPNRGVLDLRGCVSQSLAISIGAPAAVPVTPGTPIPVVPPAPPPAAPPGLPPGTGGDCIKICGFPPEEKKDGDEGEECPEPEPCELCEGALWFNKETCRIAVFIVGCGPPRDELDNWIELGTSSDADRLRRLLDEHCRQGEREDGEELPLPADGVPITTAQLCTFLPPGAALVRFTPPALIVTTLTLVARDVCGNPALRAIPGLCEFAVASAAIGSRMRDYIAEWVGRFLAAQLGANGCADGRAFTLYLAITVGNFLEKYLGFPASELTLPALQQARFACPTGIPSAEQSTAAYLANAISEDVWRCWVRANNQDDQKYSLIAEAARTKLTAVDLVNARARGMLDAQQYADRLRELGFTQRTDGEELWRLSEWIPGPTDLVRFMMRDVDDINVVRLFDLDKHFPDKFQGKVKSWSEDQRVSEDVMRRYWRAHWQFPSPSQMFEMIRRLRHRTELFPGGDPEAAVRLALVTQDYLPVWIDAFMALTYRPLTRVDARRLLELGKLTEPEAVQAWRELGYDDANAQRLVALADQAAKNRALKHPAVKRLAAGELTEPQFDAIVQSEGIADRFMPAMIARAGIESSARRRKTCIAAIRKRYLLGEIDDAMLTARIQQQDVPLQLAHQLAEGMKCERVSRGKEVAAQTVAEYYEEGLIDRAEFYARLVRLGYSQDDAVRLIRLREIRIERKLANEEKRRMLEMARRLKSEEQQRQKEIKALEGQAAKLARQAKQAESLAISREEVLNGVAIALSERTGDSVATAKGNVNRIYTTLKAQALVTDNELLSLMDEAAKSSFVAGYDDLERETLVLINARLFPVL